MNRGRQNEGVQPTLKVRAAASISYAYFSFRVTDFLDRPAPPASVQSCS